MADIFISYSKQEPEPTKALAADLEALGYTTWWDTRMLPSDGFFPQKIKDELTAAKAVIVIWGEASVTSEWVYAEAQMAKRLGKLITVQTPSLDIAEIPLPFGAQHIEPITNRTKIYAALKAWGVKPQSGEATPATNDTEPPREDAEALFKRGRDYYYGYGEKRDYLEALRFFRMAAEMNHPRAINTLGVMYANGQGVAKNKTEAVRLYRKAADMGHAKAITNLSWMYRNGWGVLKDEAEAVRLYRKAAKMGDANAITCLGVMYRNGRGVEKNEAKAARLYRKAAEMGNKVGAYNLGDCYERGMGVTKSLENARRWYQKAADLGDPDAAEALERLSA